MKKILQNMIDMIGLLFILYAAIVFSPFLIIILICKIFGLFTFEPKKTAKLNDEELAFLNEEYTQLSQKKAKNNLSHTEIADIKGYLQELDLVRNTDPKAGDFYQKFSHLIEKNLKKSSLPYTSQPNNHRIERIQHVENKPQPKPQPKPTVNTPVAKPTPKPTPTPKPSAPPLKTINYPIIKDITDPKFTAPPPPNNETDGKCDEYAAYRLNIYLGIFTNRPEHKKKISNREAGSRYERYLGYLYERAGWGVEYYGETHGVYDEGIDLICISRDEEVCHVVQAKMWSRRQVDTQDMRKFIDDFQDFYRRVTHNNPQAVFITSNHFTPEARTLAEQNNVLLLEKATMPKSYPLVKCLTRHDEKFYFTPPIFKVGKNGSIEDYVYMSADFTQGDCYVYTCAEAERRGYLFAR